MRSSAISPAKYEVTSLEEPHHHGRNQQPPRSNSVTRRQCIQFGFLISAVVIVIICLIITPVVISMLRENNKMSVDTSTPMDHSISSTTKVPEAITKEHATEQSLTESNAWLALTSMKDLTASHLTESHPSMASTAMQVTTAAMKVTTTPMKVTTTAPRSTNPTQSITKPSAAPTTDTTMAASSLSTSNPSTETSTSRTSMMTTLGVHSLIMLNYMPTTVLGLVNTTVGEDTGGLYIYYKNDSSKDPLKAMDNLTTTVHLNYGYNKDRRREASEGPGKNTGFFFIPSFNSSSVACALRFAKAKDTDLRDPTTVTLEGSNASTVEALHFGRNWKLIYNGSTGITNDTSYGNYGVQQNLTTEQRFFSYRLLITSQRGKAAAVHYAEAQIMGYR